MTDKLTFIAGSVSSMENTGATPPDAPAIAVARTSGDEMEFEQEDREECYCSSIRYDHLAAPLCVEVILLLKYMRLFLGNCCLTGGAVLNEILYQSRRCHLCCPEALWPSMMKRGSSGIDIFVHRFPAGLNRFYGREDHPDIRFPNDSPGDGEGPEFLFLLEHVVLPRFNWSYSEGRMGPLRITKWNMDRCEYFSYGSTVGIQETVELEFERNGPMIRTIVLDRLPETMVDWDTFVASAFDIDIVNVAVRVPDQSFHPQVGFTSERARRSFLSGSFVFTVRPGEDFGCGVNRIMKYRKRGFRLQGIEFDSRLTPFFKRYWMDRFRLLFLEELATDSLTKAIEQNGEVLPAGKIAEQKETLEDFKCAIQSVRNEIGAYLWKPPTRGAYLFKLGRQKKLLREFESWAS